MSKLPKTNTGITHQHHTMRSIFHPTTTFFCLLFSTALYPQTASLFEQLTAATAPQLSLTTDVSALIANKKSDTYQPGALASSAGQTFAVEVKPRGKFRRRVSEIPPLKIKVKKKLLAEAGLTDSLNELKLVLPTSLDPAGDERVVREYLAYRLYEQLSPYAVRARLINLYLVNTDLQGQSHYQVKAILLEDEEETAARLGGEMLELFGMSADKLPADHTALMVMFQYMIGNTDWEIDQQRNIRFLKTADGATIPIPFDFDFSGLVDAPYATPMAGTGLRSVKERKLMSGQLPPSALQAAAQTLLGQEQALLQTCRSAELPESSARALCSYLEQFFKELRSNQSGR